MNKSKAIFLALILFPSLIIFPQIKYKSLIVRAGVADYNQAIGNLGGGGNTYYFWKDGYHLGVGLEFPLTKTFSLQGMMEYSSFNYDKRATWGDKTNDAKNRVFDLMANLKLNIGIFHILGGVGPSYQWGDEIRYLEKTEYTNPGTYFPAKQKFVIAGLLGFGFDVHIYKQLNLTLETEMRMREYLGTCSLIGVKYAL